MKLLSRYKLLSMVTSLMLLSKRATCRAQHSFRSQTITSSKPGFSKHRHGIFARTIPALRLPHTRDGTTKDRTISTREVAAASVKTRKTQRGDGKRMRALRLPGLDVNRLWGGVYYGISPRTFEKASRSGPRKPSLSDSMLEALDELRTLRQEMEAMRKEMQTMKRKMIADGDFEEDDEAADPSKVAFARRKRQREFEKISVEVERWARRILYEEGEENGWKEVKCNKLMAGSLNKSGRTKAYMKWLPDSRGDHADAGDTQEYPCIKVFATIDAPLDDVCAYLSQESALSEYNDLVVKYKDVEEIAPHSKICWSQTPQILFFKPRDFITFCHHRWARDGTQIIVNQATEHADWQKSSNGSECRAYALRGANFMSRCPENPEKTTIAIVAHASPGGDVPHWAAKTAVNALAPIEPFKLFQKINENVQRSQPKLREVMSKAEMVSSLPGGRSPRPAGIAQMGYACFWPNGGGLQERALLDEHASASSEGDDIEKRSENGGGEEEVATSSFSEEGS